MGDIMNESEMTLAEQSLFKMYMRKNKKQLSSQIIDMRQQLKEKEEERKALLEIWKAKYIELQEDYGKACDNYKELEEENEKLKKFINEHTLNVVKLGDELCSHNSDHIVDTIGDIVNENEKLKKINKRYKYKCEILDKIVKQNVLKLLHDYDELVDVDPACEDCGDAWDDSDDEDLTL